MRHYQRLGGREIHGKGETSPWDLSHPLRRLPKKIALGDRLPRGGRIWFWGGKTGSFFKKNPFPRGEEGKQSFFVKEVFQRGQSGGLFAEKGDSIITPLRGIASGGKRRRLSRRLRKELYKVGGEKKKILYL